MAQVRGRETQEMAASAKMGAQNWREWAKSSGAGGAGRAHKWLRRLEQLREDEAGNDPTWLEQPAAGVRGFAAVMQQWYAIWQTHPTAAQLPEEGLTGLGDEADLPVITADHIYSACASYPGGKALGGDGWSLRTWAMLPRTFHHRLAALLSGLERKPESIPALATLVVLLGKPSG
eukprot:1475561-Amphidinium_carterae.1